MWRRSDFWPCDQMGWIGGALLVWFAVSLLVAPLIPLALRHLGELGSRASATDAPTIDLRRADGIRPTVLIVDAQPIRRLKMASTLRADVLQRVRSQHPNNDQLTRREAWRALLDAHAEQHAAVARIMDSTAGTPESASTAGAVCDVLASTIHIADVATTLLRTSLERDSSETSERIDLQRIIGERSFTPYFQPIVDLCDGSTVGYEALTRSDDGTDPATRFHGAASLGVGDDLELVTLRAALEDASFIAPDQFIAINVSASFITDNDDVEELLHDIPQTVVVELSEHEAIADYDAVLHVLRGLDGDVRVCVDDAGSGFASLRHILLLHPDHVKLDRSWVHCVHDDPAKRAMIAGVTHFARAIGAEVVAEGVERREECEALIDLGVQLGQGWLFGRPAPSGATRQTVSR